MREQYFLRRNGVVMGPISVERLRPMVQDGTLDGTAEISEDKQSWRNASDVFASELPPEAMPDPEDEMPEVAGNAEAAVDDETPPAAEPEPEPQPVALPDNAAEKTWKILPGKVIALLWNAPDAAAEITVWGGRWPIRALGLALLSAFGLAAYVNGLFAGHYAVSRLWLWGASCAFLAAVFLLSWSLLAGAGRWKRHAPSLHPVGNWLTAGAVTLTGAHWHVSSIALLFLLNAEWAPTRLRLALPLGVWLLWTALAGINAFAVMRRWLMTDGELAGYPAGAVSLLWTVLLFYAYLQGIVIPFIQTSGVIA